jgi:hypothetical protein
VFVRISRCAIGLPPTCWKRVFDMTARGKCPPNPLASPNPTHTLNPTFVMATQVAIHDKPSLARSCGLCDGADISLRDGAAAQTRSGEVSPEPPPFSKFKHQNPHRPEPCGFNSPVSHLPRIEGRDVIPR